MKNNKYITRTFKDFSITLKYCGFKKCLNSPNNMYEIIFFVIDSKNSLKDKLYLSNSNKHLFKLHDKDAYLHFYFRDVKCVSKILNAVKKYPINEPREDCSCFYIDLKNIKCKG